MKKHYTKSIGATLMGLVMATAFSVHAFAMTPTFSLTNTGYGAEQATIHADANAAVLLDYFWSGQLLGAGTIGYTNNSGYFSAQLNSANYSIPNGAQVVVIVNGQQSGTAVWQGTGTTQYPNQNNANLTLSQSSLSLSVGQTQTIYINNTYTNNYGSYYISSNLSSGTVIATLNGNMLTITAQIAGSTTITVCSNGGNNNYNSTGCGNVFVTVSPSYNNYNNPSYYNYNTYNQYPYYPSTNYGTTLSVSNTNVNLTAGSSVAVTIYANNYGNYGNNYSSATASSANTAVANALISGNTVTIYGYAPGSTSVNVCSTSGCTTIYVTVTSSAYYHTNQYYYPTDPYPYTQNNSWYYSQDNHCWYQNSY